MRSVFANVLLFGLITGFGVLHTLNPDVYYQHVQEDQPLEWLTFWAFMLAAVFYGRAAILERKGEVVRVPWFLVGLSAFCFVVAMEEISWGQRLFGYETPRYFLQNNYQQELNVHNVMGTSLRKLTVALILGGYGLLLPLLRRLRWTSGLFTKLGLQAPPASLAPAFAALLVVYVTYPWRYTGEIVEAGMGLAFLFSALVAFHERDVLDARFDRWMVLTGSLSLVIALGFGSALWSRGRLAADPVVVEVTATEIKALRRDIAKVMRDADDLCGHHERLTHFSSRSEAKRLHKGRFVRLTEYGLPEERAEFFIDPWSTAYWVRTTCNKRRNKVFLYSFGPNRRRDSSRWKLKGDDIGVIFRIRHEDQDAGAVSRRD